MNFKFIHEDKADTENGESIRVCLEPGCVKTFEYASKLKEPENSHAQLETVDINYQICGSKQLRNNIELHLRTRDKEVSKETFEGCELTFSNARNPRSITLGSFIYMRMMGQEAEPRIPSHSSFNGSGDRPRGRTTHAVGHLREVSNKNHNVELKLFLEIEIRPLEDASVGGGVPTDGKSEVSIQIWLSFEGHSCVQRLVTYVQPSAYSLHEESKAAPNTHWL
ncbi:hypothetical protein Tco_1298745 [Tanacetum coccineum]